MDNEAPKSLNKYNSQEDIGYQLVPPHINRVIAADQAIRTCKYHFSAELASIDTQFTVHL